MTKRQALAVFWDMDGTLIDTEMLHYEVIRDWCAGHGLTLSEADNSRLMGKTMPEKWAILEPQLDAEACEEDFREQCEAAYMARLQPSMALERSASVVRKLQDHGVLQACVSNGEAAVVRANIEAIGLAEAFTFIISGEDVESGKPAPDPYKAAAATANLDVRQCLVVEDSAVGIRSALDAGCIVCAWPVSPEAIPAEARDADYVLETEADFPYDIVS